MDRFVAKTDGKRDSVLTYYSTFAESEGNIEHDQLMYSPRSVARAMVTGIPIGDQGVAMLQGPLIVGAGPAGLACAVELTMGSVPYVILERDMCITSMWHCRTYRRLCLHLPKRYCQLPRMPFPHSYPTYPTKQQFLAYLDEYKRNHGIRPFFNMEVGHILPREIMGLSTFTLSVWLLKFLNVKIVDQILLLLARLILGDTKYIGISRPTLGPMELKSLSSKTPVLDVGTISKIKSGDIKVFPAIESFQERGVQFIDGRIESFDVAILATGYKSNVPYWLKVLLFLLLSCYP
ncbi:Indole-3-pyruvate monooxygenase YUCCA6 [Zea mays]|uniref:indole-3-pyruvate monooxygenase n=1 Tax=Zea mays TaxID=4577 RepID=A0A317Y911_MAIZE|nr:Indole-3-pyruvate monooxygenase YUCCA6 [Zea mays]